jgi:glycosyltransferase involved in cell wall biosynthesis
LNVLIVDPSLFAPAYDYHLCRALAEIGDSVTMIGRPLREYEPPVTGPFAFADLFYRRAAQREASWRTSRLGRISKGFEHLAGLLALERLASEKRADIVHFQWLVLPILDSMTINRLRRRCGLVLTVHNAELTTHSSASVIGTFGAMLQSLGQRAAALGFERYIVHSARTLESLIQLGITPERIVLRQHPPLDLEGKCSPHLQSEADKRPSILYFGAIKPYKGVDVLIEAGIAMAATRRDFRITIAGRPFQSLDALRARIAKAGATDLFHFDLDYIPDDRLAAYLMAASVVVFPYREIDGSGALSHAIRFGKPIVASSVGGFAEAPFKDYLELVNPEDANALATLLMTLLDTPDRLEVLARRTSALQELLPSWTDYALACRSAYREILAQRKSP